jgi:malonate-semialdehyde dehydrogenase (acetylating)/methylmalonate-semialdehyde dehydrogenase
MFQELNVSIALIDHVIPNRSPAQTAQQSDIFNPATGEVTGRLTLGSALDVDIAVKAAQAAFPAWAATPPHVRARVMFRFRDLIERHLDRLAAIITAEHGKVISDAKGELIRGLEVVEFACGIPQVLKGEYSEQVGKSIEAVSFRQPLGVGRASRLSTFPLWCRCGCSLLLWHAAIPSSSSLPSAIQASPMKSLPC